MKPDKKIAYEKPLVTSLGMVVQTTESVQLSGGGITSAVTGQNHQRPL